MFGGTSSGASTFGNPSNPLAQSLTPSSPFVTQSSNPFNRPAGIDSNPFNRSQTRDPFAPGALNPFNRSLTHTHTGSFDQTPFNRSQMFVGTPGIDPTNPFNRGLSTTSTSTPTTAGFGTTSGFGTNPATSSFGGFATATTNPAPTSFGFGPSAAPTPTTFGFGQGTTAATSSFGFNPSSSSVFGATSTAAPSLPYTGNPTPSTFTATQSLPYFGNPTQSFSTPTQQTPLGFGAAPQQALAVSGATKFGDLPDAAKKQLEQLRKTINEHKAISEEIEKRSTIAKLPSLKADVNSLVERAGSLCKTLGADKEVVTQFRIQVTQLLRNADNLSLTIQRLSAKPYLPQSIQLPPPYFWELLNTLEGRVQQCKRAMSDIGGYLQTSNARKHFNPSDLEDLIRHGHDVFLVITAQVALVHESMEKQRDAYLQYLRKQSTNGHITNPFEEKRRPTVRYANQPFTPSRPIDSLFTPATPTTTTPVSTTSTFPSYSTTTTNTPITPSGFPTTSTTPSTSFTTPISTTLTPGFGSFANTNGGSSSDRRTLSTSQTSTTIANNRRKGRGNSK